MIMYRIVNKQYHHFIQDRFQEFQVVHRHETRFKFDMKVNIPKIRISKSKQCFLFQATIEWNNVPSDIRNSCNLKTFKKKLKLHHLSQRN